jgi:hypothetical protein
VHEKAANKILKDDDINSVTDFIIAALAFEEIRRLVIVNHIRNIF